MDSYQFYPLDVVCGRHGVQGAAHRYPVAALDGLYHRHVLLRGGIGGVGFHQLHGLTAAGQRSATGIDHFDHIATHGATVHLLSLCHSCSFLLE